MMILKKLFSVEKLNRDILWILLESSECVLENINPYSFFPAKRVAVQFEADQYPKRDESIYNKWLVSNHFILQIKPIIWQFYV